MQNVPDFHGADFKELFNRVIEDSKSHARLRAYLCMAVSFLESRMSF